MRAMLLRLALVACGDNELPDAAPLATVHDLVGGSAPHVWRRHRPDVDGRCGDGHHAAQRARPRANRSSRAARGSHGGGSGPRTTILELGSTPTALWLAGGTACVDTGSDVVCAAERTVQP